MADVRRAVVSALIKQEKDGYSNLILKSALQNFSGTKEECAFFTAVFYGTIERCITIDYILQKFLTKPINKLDAQVRCIMRSALYQALYMQSVPTFAAINEAVTLTRKMGKSSAAGMVNAVLRKASAYQLSEEKFKNEAERVSVMYSVSLEIAQIFIDKLRDNYELILQKSFEKANICLRVNSLRTTIEDVEKFFAEINVDTKRGFVQNCLYVDFKGDITQSKLFAEGLIHVQGEASQLVCAVLDVKCGQKTADVCAAPGGKSVTLAQYMGDNGTLFSCDNAQNRLPLIEKAMERMGVKCATVLHADARLHNKLLDNCDNVLCDVPCSGLGIMAKKPDIRMKNLRDIDELTKIQFEILNTSAKYIKNGGKIMYSTCTLNPAENEEIVLKFLNENKNFSLCKIDKLPENSKCIDGCVTLYPHGNMSDGFFMALMTKHN